MLCICIMRRRPARSTQSRSSAASDVNTRQTCQCGRHGHHSQFRRHVERKGDNHGGGERRRQRARRGIEKTNNTAELQVVIEALLFLLAQVDARKPLIDFHSYIIIHSDSKYACGIIRDGARTNTNETMVNIMAHLWKRTRLAYDIRMV